MTRFAARSPLPVSADELYCWHARAGAFQRLMPPWEQLRLVQQSGGIADGARVAFDIRQGPVWLRWEAEHSDHIEGRQFRDTMLRMSGTAWTHLHRFEPAGDVNSQLIDEIDFTLPFGALGRLGTATMLRKLQRLFAFRHRRTRDDLLRHAAFAHRSRLDIAISGASGLIGSQLCAFLSTGGHRVRRLVRRNANSAAGEITWDPSRGEIDSKALEGVDAVIHLAGENIASGRWTAARKKSILTSRVDSTRLLAETIARLERPPRVFVSASAVGFYGDRGDPVDESSGTGTGFLAEVCRAWEEAAEPARAAGLRVVHPRIGMVVAGQGGALAKLLTPFRLGLGGPVGGGKQMTSWISLDDLLGVLHWILFDEAISGPVNAVSPKAIDNRRFVQTLGAVLNRPAILPLPAFAVRLAFGEMGQRVLLDGAAVRPARLLAAGFPFLHPEIETAVRSELGSLAPPEGFS